MTASPISDLNPVFMAAGCKLTLMDKGNTHLHTHTQSTTGPFMTLKLTCFLSDGSRVVPMDDGFFTGYRRTVVKPQEVLVSIQIPFSKKVRDHHR